MDEETPEFEYADYYRCGAMKKLANSEESGEEMIMYNNCAAESKLRKTMAIYPAKQR